MVKIDGLWPLKYHKIPLSEMNFDLISFMHLKKNLERV